MNMASSCRGSGRWTIQKESYPIPNQALREASVAVLEQLSEQGTEVSTKALLALAQTSPADGELHWLLHPRAQKGGVQRA